MTIDLNAFRVQSANRYTMCFKENNLSSGHSHCLLASAHPRARRAGQRKEEERGGSGSEGGGRGAESGREERGGEQGGGQEDAWTEGREEGRGCGGT